MGIPLTSQAVRREESNNAPKHRYSAMSRDLDLTSLASSDKCKYKLNLAVRPTGGVKKVSEN